MIRTHNIQIEDKQQYYSNQRYKMLKGTAEGKFYYLKIINGDQKYINHAKHYLENRFQKFIYKNDSFNKKYWIQPIVANGQPFLHLYKEWFNHNDPIQQINACKDDIEALQLTQKLISQFLVEVLIGPIQFFYSYFNVLFDAQIDQFEINYFSFLGFEIINDQLTINETSLTQVLPLLYRQNFNNSKFSKFNHHNKLRSIGIFIFYLIERRRFICNEERKINCRQIQVLVDSRQKQLEDRIYEKQFYNIVYQIQQSLHTNYYKFLETVICKNKSLAWDEIIQFLVVRQRVQIPNKEEMIDFKQVFASTAKKLYEAEDPFVKDRLRQLHIVIPGSYQNYELYLKIKIASTTQELLFLLRFQFLVHLIYFKAFEDNKLVEKIFKKFVHLMITLKNNTKLQQNQSQNKGLNAIELKLIQAISKLSQIIVGDFLGHTYKTRNSENIMLNRYLKL